MKRRWDCIAAEKAFVTRAPGDRLVDSHVESPPEVEAFLADIFTVYRKHQLTIGHEDGHGSFLIHEFDEGNIEWLDAANLHIRLKENV